MREEPPVSTTMPSALRGGLCSSECSCETNQPKPATAATTTTANALTKPKPDRRRVARLVRSDLLTSDFTITLIRLFRRKIQKRG